MCQPCAVLFEDGSPHDASGCLLTIGHDGPHEFIDDRGKVWLWETDLTCDCEHCMRCEGDYCSVYWERPQAAGASSRQTRT